MSANKQSSSRDGAFHVLMRLREAGHVAYFAGGCVRDVLLELDPKDWDVATDAPPARVRQIFPDTQAVGAAFGVILVRVGGFSVEVATFRADGPYTDGRRPDAIKFVTAEQDAQRRDFTINGLFFDPVDNQVIDYVGGQADLQARVLRTIGDPDARFSEDHLRLLRAVRFAARLDMTIDDNTARAVRRHAPHLIRIAPERIADELRVILTGPTRRRARRWMRELGLDRYALRFAKVSASVDSAANSVWDTFDTPSISFPLALAGLSAAYALASTTETASTITADLARQVHHDARTFLRLSNDELDALKSILLQTASILSDPHPRVATLKRFLAEPTADDSRTLLAGLMRTQAAPHGVGDTLTRLDQLSQELCAPVPLVTGDDLVKLGYAPGPDFKTVLWNVYDAQLEGAVSTTSEALTMARQVLDNR